MITKKEFNKAKQTIKECEKTISDYHIQEKKRREANQKEREDKCPGHEYINASYKWGNPNRMKCIYCGRVIND